MIRFRKCHQIIKRTDRIHNRLLSTISPSIPFILVLLLNIPQEPMMVDDCVFGVHFNNGEQGNLTQTFSCSCWMIFIECKLGHLNKW